MQNTITIRVPEKVREDIEILVEKGYYKNISDLVVSAVRTEIKEKNINPTVLEVKKLREELWNKFLNEAKGDKEEASKLYFNKMKKSEKEMEERFARYEQELQKGKKQ